VIESFYKKFSETSEQGVKRISLEQLRELVEFYDNLDLNEK